MEFAGEPDGSLVRLESAGGQEAPTRGDAAYWIASFLPALAAFFGSVSSSTPLA